METFSEQELFLNDLWANTTICQISPDEYIEFIKTTIKQLKDEKLLKEAQNFLLKEIVNKYLICYLDFELFENIKFHVVSDNNNHKNSYYIIFVLVFLIDCSKNQKLRMIEEIGILLEDIYKDDFYPRKNKNLIKNVIIRYIDLVSFITLAYHLKIILNKNNEDYYNKYSRVLKSFRVENRKKLLNILFESFDNFDLEDFLDKNNRNLEHYKIRKFLIETDFGKNGLTKIKFTDNSDTNEENIKLK
jgi:hypothetical protein